MIGKTQFAITGEDTRYYLNGALIVIKDKQMTMVATDGHRLALVNCAARGRGRRRETRDHPEEDADRTLAPAGRGR